MTVKLINEPYPLGTGGSIALLPKNVEENFLVINGDVLTNIDLDSFINTHIKNNNDTTIAAALNKMHLQLV